MEIFWFVTVILPAEKHSVDGTEALPKPYIEHILEKLGIYLRTFFAGYQDAPIKKQLTKIEEKWIIIRAYNISNQLLIAFLLPFASIKNINKYIVNINNQRPWLFILPRKSDFELSFGVIQGLNKI